MGVGQAVVCGEGGLWWMGAVDIDGGVGEWCSVLWRCGDEWCVGLWWRGWGCGYGLGVVCSAMVMGGVGNCGGGLRC